VAPTLATESIVIVEVLADTLVALTVAAGELPFTFTYNDACWKRQAVFLSSSQKEPGRSPALHVIHDLYSN
jgi:hypothetical protein